MRPPRASLVVIGEVVIAAWPGGPERAEAIGIANGRVSTVGSRADVMDAAKPDARVVDAGRHAVVPGLHDFHLHLVGMARARREVLLDDAPDFEAALAAVAAAAERQSGDSWLRGRGWRESVLASGDLDRLGRALAGRPALIYSHDGHSAWASPDALRMAGIDRSTADPAGGRIDRDANREPNGLLRERAADLVDRVAGRLRGAALDEALVETIKDLASLGITGVVDAGDSTPDNGLGEYAALGDRASMLADARGWLDGRLRLSINVPAAAIRAASGLGLKTGEPLPGVTTVRAGWAKTYVDGALGSRTAALFDPYTCGPPGETGIPRLTDEELDAIVTAGREARIGLAVHAIGDRGAAMVLDAFERAPPSPRGVPPDRMEHLQLMRPEDARRLAANDITASVQPIHCASDRDLVDACWAGRQQHAYPWRTIVEAGSRLVFGSDAPIESPNPWLGIFAAAHRRYPSDGTADWHAEQALDPNEALAGYTTGPAAAAGLSDEGHLRPGAHADLAVLNVDVATLLRADEALGDVRSELTLVAGNEVHRS
jgi:predicted amidohydrolase YtcJ